jgi:hypothetical protein
MYFLLLLLLLLLLLFVCRLTTCFCREKEIHSNAYKVFLCFFRLLVFSDDQNNSVFSYSLSVVVHSSLPVFIQFPVFIFSHSSQIARFLTRPTCVFPIDILKVFICLVFSMSFVLEVTAPASVA